MKRTTALLFLLVAWLAPAAGQPAKIDILRDRWGIPHVFAASEAEGFYGIGYITA